MWFRESVQVQFQFENENCMLVFVWNGNHKANKHTTKIYNFLSNTAVEILTVKSKSSIKNTSCWKTRSMEHLVRMKRSAICQLIDARRFFVSINLIGWVLWKCLLESWARMFPRWKWFTVDPIQLWVMTKLAWISTDKWFILADAFRNRTNCAVRGKCT